MTANSVTTIRKNEALVTNDSAFVALPEQVSTYEEVMRLEAQITALKKTQDDLKKALRRDMEMLNVSKLVTAGNETLATLTTSVRNTFDSKRFREDDPDTAALYLTETEVETFKVYK